MIPTRTRHPILHADHGLTAAHLDFVQSVLAGWDGTFVLLHLDLPSHLLPLPSGLHGPACGDDPIPESEVWYAVRGRRAGPSRLCARPPRMVRKIVIVAGPGRTEPVVYTAFGSQAVALREPWDPSLDAAGKAEATAFWAVHALSS